MSPRIEDNQTTGIAIALSTANTLEDVIGLFRDVCLNVVGDGATELAKYLWVRYQRRSKGKEAQKVIEDISILKELDSNQQEILKRLPEYIKRYGSKIRRNIAEGKDWKTVLVNWLEENGFGNEHLAEEVITSIIHDIREIIIQTISPHEMYRQALEHHVVLKDLQELVYEEYKKVIEASKIGLTFPLEFKPLNKVLGQEFVVYAYERFKEDYSYPLPEPEFFRRPRVEWIDIDDRCVYVRESILKEIKQGFESTNMQLLIGEAGSGKSLLGFVFGHEVLKKQESPVFYLDFLEHRTAILDQSIRQVVLDLHGSNLDSCLLIVDNIHMSPRLAANLFEKLVHPQLTGNAINILFIARVDDIKESSSIDRLHAEIAGTGSAKKHLQIHVLQSEDFEDAVKGIVEKFFNYHMIDYSVTKVAFDLSMRCQRNLWLLTFYLNAISENNSIDLDSIDVCKELITYYFSEDPRERIQDKYSVLQSIKNKMGESLNDREKRRILEDILLNIALTSQIDVPYPIEFLYKQITPAKIQPSISADLRIKPDEFKDILQRCVHELENQGELVLLEKFDLPHVSFPHSTLALEISRCTQLSTHIPVKNLDDRWLEILDFYGGLSIVPERLLFAILPFNLSDYPGSELRNAYKILKWISSNIILFNPDNEIHAEIVDRYVQYHIELAGREDSFKTSRLILPQDVRDSLGSLFDLEAITPRAHIRFHTIRPCTKVDYYIAEVITFLEYFEHRKEFNAILIHANPQVVNQMKTLFQDRIDNRIRLFNPYDELAEILDWIKNSSYIVEVTQFVRKQLNSNPMKVVAKLHIAFGDIINHFQELSHNDQYRSEIGKIESLSDKLRTMTRSGVISEEIILNVVESLLRIDHSIA